MNHSRWYKKVDFGTNGGQTLVKCAEDGYKMFAIEIINLYVDYVENDETPPLPIKNYMHEALTRIAKGNNPKSVFNLDRDDKLIKQICKDKREDELYRDFKSYREYFPLRNVSHEDIYRILSSLKYPRVILNSTSFYIEDRNGNKIYLPNINFKKSYISQARTIKKICLTKQKEEKRIKELRSK